MSLRGPQLACAEGSEMQVDLVIYENVRVIHSDLASADISEDPWTLTSVERPELHMAEA